MKNRYAGKIKIVVNGEVIDVAVIKVHKRKGKSGFMAALIRTIREVIRTKKLEDVDPIDFQYEGDFGEDLTTMVVASGGKFLGVIDGTLDGAV